MSEPSLTLQAHELICDEPGCGHVETVGDIDANMVGKPCPKCGASLLTEGDFIEASAMLGAIKAIAAVLPPIEDGPTESVLMSFNPHNGAMKIEVRPDDGD